MEADRVVLITGGCGAVGAAIASLLANAGATLALIDRDAERLHATVTRLSGITRVLGVACDLLDHAGLERTTDRIASELGPIDVLVNNAAIAGPIGPLRDADMDAWDNVMRINYQAPLRLCRTLLPGMIDRGYGRIVNLSSRAVSGFPGANTAYSVSKVALTRLTAHIAREVAGTQVTANAVCPGAVQSGISAEIRDKVRDRRADVSADLLRYVDTVEAGGASPNDAAQLVRRIINDPMINGSLLFCEGGEQVVRPLVRSS
jgi:NAD(P)-dependent dehydrogenase (short-subunit alcohol dehydrogenase family)